MILQSKRLTTNILCDDNLNTWKHFTAGFQTFSIHIYECLSTDRQTSQLRFDNFDVYVVNPQRNDTRVIATHLCSNRKRTLSEWNKTCSLLFVRGVILDMLQKSAEIH